MTTNTHPAQTPVHFEVATLSADGWVLADLYSGTDDDRAALAVNRGLASAREAASHVDRVQVLVDYADGHREALVNYADAR